MVPIKVLYTMQLDILEDALTIITVTTPLNQILNSSVELCTPIRHTTDTYKSQIQRVDLTYQPLAIDLTSAIRDHFMESK